MAQILYFNIFLVVILSVFSIGLASLGELEIQYEDPILKAGLFEGDINGVRAQQAESAASSTAYWPGGMVHFVTGDDLDKPTITAIFEALREIRAKTCIKFLPRTTQTNYIQFTIGDDPNVGCQSYVGRRGGAQDVVVGPGCAGKGVLLHLLMHVLGFWHEHSRRDRDQYINVHYDRIANRDRNNFKKYTVPESHHSDEPYDYDSILHLSQDAFSTDAGRPSMSRKSGSGQLGQMTELSPSDVRKINQRYCTAWMRSDRQGSSRNQLRRKRSKSYSADANPLEIYAADKSIRWHPAQKELMNVTLALPWGLMMGAPEVVQLNMNLMRLIGARNVIDVGLFTGYSALGAALVIPKDGQVIGIDITDEYWNATGQGIFKKYGLDDKIVTEIIPYDAGNVVLDRLLAEGRNGTFDFCFIDADKDNYPNYYEKCLELLRPNGIITLDNAFLGGRVLDANLNEDWVYTSSKIMDSLNSRIRDDPRVWPNLLPMADGLIMAIKKPPMYSEEDWN